MKIKINLTSLISAIVGGLFINFYAPIFLVCVYVLKNFNKNLSLFVFVLYLLSIGFLVSFKSLYTNWEVIFFVVIPHLLFLGDILKEDENHQNTIVAFMLLLSYFYKYLFFILVLYLLFNAFYKELDIRGVIIPIGFVILGIFIFWQYFNLLSYDYLSQVMVLIGVGLVSFFMFLFKKE
ncbi:hypothetical protein ACO3TA_07595 [Methanocaldococcus sp. 28A]